MWNVWHTRPCVRVVTIEKIMYWHERININLWYELQLKRLQSCSYRKWTDTFNNAVVWNFLKCHRLKNSMFLLALWKGAKAPSVYFSTSLPFEHIYASRHVTSTDKKCKNCCQENGLDVNITMPNWSCWNLHIKSLFDLVSTSVSSFYHHSHSNKRIFFTCTHCRNNTCKKCKISVIRCQLWVTYTASEHMPASGFELSDLQHTCWESSGLREKFWLNFSFYSHLIPKHAYIHS